MHILLKKAKILNPASPFHRRRLDILIRNGTIRDIGKNLKAEKAEVVSSKNLHVCAGFVDIGTQICEPGFEFRETIDTIRDAALSGGYTTIACLPNTDPVIQNRSEVEYVINRGKTVGLDIHPIGALSQNTAGKDLTQMMEMHDAGAVGFSDGRKPIHDSGLLLRALQYIKPFHGVVFDLPYDRNVAPHGQIHEGKTSTKLGMEGIPSIAEELTIARNLALLEYAESRMHLRGISTREGLQLVKEGQRAGLAVTCDISAFHLMFSEDDLESFDSNLKIFPPFRSRRDINALVRGIKDGTIQHIASFHEPLEIERKKLEFPYADFGSVGLESAFSMAHTVLKGKIALVDLLHQFTDGPRDILGLEKPVIDTGRQVNMAVFDPDKEWVFEEKHIRSQSKNAAAIGKKFLGRVIGGIARNGYVLGNG